MIAFNLRWRDPSVPEQHNPNLNAISDEKNAEISEWLRADKSFCSEMELITEDGAEGYSKWIDCEEDMARLSLAFPAVLFVLYGSGEMDEDLWVSYCLGGRGQFARAEIHYPAFDPEQLAELP